MIDPDLIPGHVLSRKSIADLNSLIARLESRKVDRIVIPESGSGFRASNLARVYCQAHLRRCLVLADGAYSLFFVEKGLISLIAVRTIYETVAEFVAFEKEFQQLVANADLQDIFDFVKRKSYATRNKKLVAAHGQSVLATNVMTQIAKLKSVRADIEEEYDFLSDLTHPNGIGASLYFRVDDTTTDVAEFGDGGPDPAADLQWILVGIKLLEQLEAAMDRIEKVLPALSERGRLSAPSGNTT